MLISALHDAVDFLKFWCASIASCLGSIKAHYHTFDGCFNTLAASFHDLSTKLATNDTMLKTLAEAQQVVFEAVSTFTEKMNFLAAHLETVTIPPVDSPSRDLQKSEASPIPTTSSGS
ncbi:hypothetical protein SK128_022973, partial [Halocaridina rubra]